MDNPPRGLVPATDDHARALADGLSADHLREIADLSGLAPGDALRLSIAASFESYAFVPKDADGSSVSPPVFLMGVERAAGITGDALVWMLSSPRIRHNARSALRAAKWGLRRAFAATGARRLEQYIPEWYGTGLRFAERLGFRIDPFVFRTRNRTPVARIILQRKEEHSWES